MTERDRLVAALPPLAYLERACAHVRLGWLPRIESIGVKVALGRHQHADFTTSVKLERAHWALTRLAGDPAEVPARLRARMMRIDGAATSGEALAGLYHGVKRALAERYAALIRAADPVLDANLLEVLVPALAEAERQVRWARAEIGARRSEAAAILGRALSGPRLSREAWLWAPRSRVPACTRPEHHDRRRPGSLRFSLDDPPGTRGALGEFFHHMTGSEIAVAELFGRCSYEHPEMPEDFHRDYSRVVADEARHAEVALHHAARFRRPFGTLPIDTTTYGSLYQFAPCAAGSRRELLWRLLLQGTLREGLIIEGFTMQAKKLRYDHWEELARVVETVAAEEVPHVGIALRWARHLCDGDDARVEAEREAAHAHYHGNYTAVRKQLVADRPDEAIAETEKFQRYIERSRARFPFSLALRVDRAARKAAGFTAAQMTQEVRWGYLQR